MALKNRIVFLQQNLEVQKRVSEFYAKLIQDLNTGAFSYAPYPAIQINHGGIEMDQRKYVAKNAVNVAQGDEHSNEMKAENINIGSTVNERKDLLDKLEKLISLMGKEEHPDDNFVKSKRQFESVKDELTDESEPDKSLITKFLGKAKSLLEMAKVGGEILNQAKDVFNSFGLF